MTIFLTKQQKEIVKQLDKKGISMIAGGIASGKSVILGYYLARELTKFRWLGWFRKKKDFLIFTKQVNTEQYSLIKSFAMLGLKFKVIGGAIFYKNKPRIIIMEYPHRNFEYDELIVDKVNDIKEIEFRAFKRDKNILIGNPEDAWFKTKCDNIYNLSILDNPYLAEEYLEALKELPTGEYDRYVKGDWNYKKEPKDDTISDK